MSLSIIITIPPFPEGAEMTPQQFLDHIQNSTFEQSGDGLVGQIGGSRPAEDEGVFFNTEDFTIEFWDSSLSKYRTATDVPVGCAIPDFSKPTADVPANFLVCDGSQILQASYPELYARLGDTWGTADAGKFRLPDMRGRVAVGTGTGSDDRGTYNAGAQSGINGVMESRQVGDYFGSEAIHAVARPIGGPGKSTKLRGASIINDNNQAKMASIQQPSAVCRWIIRYR